jgi:hypothetical protein
MSRIVYRGAARLTVLIHFLWTILIFAGAITVLFNHQYAWYQIDIMSITILSWFPFGLRCALTVGEHYFEKKAGIFDGDNRTFMVKRLSRFFGKEFRRRNIATVTAIFFVISYMTSIGILAGWFR